jgi:hypothetical protein
MARKWRNPARPSSLPPEIGKPAISAETAGFILVAGACNHQELRSVSNYGVRAALLAQAQILATYTTQLGTLFRAAA